MDSQISKTWITSGPPSRTELGSQRSANFILFKKTHSFRAFRPGPEIFFAGGTTLPNVYFECNLSNTSCHTLIYGSRLRFSSMPDTPVWFSLAVDLNLFPFCQVFLDFSPVLISSDCIRTRHQKLLENDIFAQNRHYQWICRPQKPG